MIVAKVEVDRVRERLKSQTNIKSGQPILDKRQICEENELESDTKRLKIEEETLDQKCVEIPSQYL